ncbi:MAG: ABC transporter permease [Actinomycetota bacterium]|nr:ABC transporter permease [Actinomycetota bacterium]
MATGTAAPPAALPPLSKRLAEKGVTPRLLLLLPAVVFALGLFVYPFLYGLGLSFTTGSASPLSNYQEFFSDPYLRGTIWLTVRLAVPAVLIILVAAMPLALAMRGAGRAKQAITVILLFPITIGTVLLSRGLLNFLGPAGWVNRFLLDTGLIDQPIQLTYNYWGVLFAIIITDFPLVFLLLLSYAGGIDPTYERAAAVFGASARQRFFRVTLPLFAPGLAITTSLAFVLAFGTFPSALLLGEPAGSTRTMGVAAYSEAFQQFDYPMAATVAMLMAGLELLVIVLILGLRSRLAPTVSSGRKG